MPDVVEAPKFTDEEILDKLYVRVTQRICPSSDLKSGMLSCCGMGAGRPDEEEAMLGISLWVTEKPDPFESKNTTYEYFEYEGKVLNIACLHYTEELEDHYENWKKKYNYLGYTDNPKNTVVNTGLLGLLTYHGKYFDTIYSTGIDPVLTKLTGERYSFDGLKQTFHTTSGMQRALRNRFITESKCNYALTISVTKMNWGGLEETDDTSLVDIFNLEKVFQSKLAYNSVHTERCYDSIRVNIYKVKQ